MRFGMSHHLQKHEQPTESLHPSVPRWLWMQKGLHPWRSNRKMCFTEILHWSVDRKEIQFNLLNGNPRNVKTISNLSFEYFTAPCYENEVFMASGGKRCEYKCNDARKCRYIDDAHNNCLCKPNFYRDSRTLKCMTAKECRNRATKY